MSRYFSRLAGRCGLKQAHIATAPAVSNEPDSTHFTPAPLEIEQVNYVNPPATTKTVVNAGAVNTGIAGARAVPAKTLQMASPQATQTSAHGSRITEALNAKSDQVISRPITADIEMDTKQDRPARSQQTPDIKVPGNPQPVAAEQIFVQPEAQIQVDSVQQSSLSNELPQQPETVAPDFETRMLITEVDKEKPAALKHHQFIPGLAEQGPVLAEVSSKSSSVATDFDLNRATHISSKAFREHKTSSEQIPQQFPVVEREHSLSRLHSSPDPAASSINVQIATINIDVQQHFSKPVTEVLRTVQHATGSIDKGAQSDLSPSRYYLRGF